MGRVLTIYLNDARLKLLGGDEGSVSLQKRIYALIDGVDRFDCRAENSRAPLEKPGDSSLPGDGGHPQ